MSVNTKKLSYNKTLRKLTSKWQLYAFLLIPLVYIIVFAYVPMYGAQIAFKKFDPALGIWGSPFIGFDNFVKFFKNYQFKRVITNTIVLSLYSIMASFPLPIVLALGLNAINSKYFRKTVQMVTYVPHFISTVVIVGMVFQLLNNRVGAYGIIYKYLFDATAPDLFGKADIFRHIYVWSGIWQNVGWNSIIYFAALSNVDPQQHEAAIVDGASRFKRIIHVDLPGIVPTAVILLILNCGNIMNVGFEKIFLFQNDLNLRASEVISTYVYKAGIIGGTDFSYATAIGLFNSVVGLILILIVNYFAKKAGDTSLW